MKLLVTFDIIDFHENLHTNTNMKIKLFEIIVNIVLELYQYGILIPQMYPCPTIYKKSIPHQLELKY